MDPFSLLLLLVIAAGGFFLYRILTRRKGNSARIDEINQWFETQAALASDPDTDPATLRGLLAMENPHDDMFYARLAVLRALATNPSLPPELQAAAINRVAQEETAAQLDKSLRNLAKNKGGPASFVGFSTEI